MEFVQLPGTGAPTIVVEAEGDVELGLGFVQLPGAGGQVAPGRQSGCDDSRDESVEAGCAMVRGCSNLKQCEND